MFIEKIENDHKMDFIELLFLADEQMDMIEKYLYRGEMFALYNGFKISYRVKNFFTDNYDHPMFEEGVQLIDMVYLSKEL